MEQQLPVGENEQAIDDDPDVANEAHEQNEQELDEVFGEPDMPPTETLGDSGTDAVPSGMEP